MMGLKELEAEKQKMDAEAANKCREEMSTMPAD
jgi:hypothetical protein